ncbi:MAG: hypothetical protein ACI8UQ_001310 [Bacteroidia bacterium]|jgi:hypothetical protein
MFVQLLRISKLIPQAFIVLFIFGYLSSGAQEDFKGMKSELNLEKEYEQFLEANYIISRKQPKTAYRKELKEFYKTRFYSSKRRLEDGHFLLNIGVNDYLAGVTQTIAEANEEFDFSQIRVLMARYTWPNAFSVGDGTLAINMGLILQLKNESQLAFILCHEASHFFLNHSDNDFIEKYNARNSAEFIAKLEEINDSEYYQATKLKVLLKANIYSERSHTRSLEYQADSLGLVMYLNAGYDISEAMSTLRLLDKLNDPIEMDLPLFQIFNIDTVKYPPSSLNIQNSHKDDVLEEDSVKTHPDCEQRLAVFEEIQVVSDPKKPKNTDDFKSFQVQLVTEEVHSMLYFNSVDEALVQSLYKRKQGDSGAVNSTAIIIELYKLVEARKTHNLTKFVSKPSKDQSKSLNELSDIVYGLRYSEFSKKFYALAKSIYPAAIQNDKVDYAMLSLAYYAKDKANFKTMQKEYENKHSGSDLLWEARRLSLD